LGSAQKFAKVNFCRYVIEALRRKVDYMEFYGRNFGNVEMSNL
jgi:glutathione synthase